jgi:beta-lactam-binding protein with PASTA domain
MSANAVVAVVTAVLALVVVLCIGAGLATVSGPRAGRSPSAPVSASAVPGAVRPPAAAVPDVTGRPLVEAERVVRAAGFTHIDRVDASASKRLVLNRRNWIVTAQTPVAGKEMPVAATVTLSVRKIGDRSGGSRTRPGVVPDVVCRDLQTAQDTLQAAGFYNLRSEDGSGQARVQVIDENWVVIAQSARPGTTAGRFERIVLRAVKFGEPTARTRCRR